MKVAIGADHAGVHLKAHLVKELERLGHEAIDLGTDSTESVDYPPICAAVGRAVVAGDADRDVHITPLELGGFLISTSAESATKLGGAQTPVVIPP